MVFYLFINTQFRWITLIILPFKTYKCIHWETSAETSWEITAINMITLLQFPFLSLCSIPCTCQLKHFIIKPSTHVIQPNGIGMMNYISIHVCVYIWHFFARYKLTVTDFLTFHPLLWRLYACYISSPLKCFWPFHESVTKAEILPCNVPCVFIGDVKYWARGAKWIGQWTIGSSRFMRLFMSTMPGFPAGCFLVKKVKLFYNGQLALIHYNSYISIKIVQSRQRCGLVTSCLEMCHIW